MLFCREVWSIESYFWQRNLSTDVHVGSDDRSYLWHQLGKLTVDGFYFVGLMVKHLKCRFARIVCNPIEKQIVFLCLLKLIPCQYKIFRLYRTYFTPSRECWYLCAYVTSFHEYRQPWPQWLPSAPWVESVPSGDGEIKKVKLWRGFKGKIHFHHKIIYLIQH